jgi:LysR family transcriptional regulator of gallate degradation
MRPHVLNPKHLRAFLAVTRAGSLVKSGRLLHRAQSAVTRAIKELEREVDSELFERHARGMMLTETGRTLLVRTERAFDEMEAARAAFATDLAEGMWQRNAPVFTLSIGRQRLSVLIELAEQRSMAAVAVSLGISQSAVSQALREIETGLGVKIFKRTTLGMWPTPLGAVLALHVKRAFAELRIAEDEIHSLKSNVQGSVIVGSLSLGRTRLLPYAVTRLLRRHPNLTIRTEEGSFETLARHLREGELDFILGALRTPESTGGFEREVVAHDVMGLVVRQNHPLTRQAGLSLADVVPASWVLPKKGAPTREMLDATLRARGLPEARVHLETTDLAITLGALVSSDMVTAISPHLYRREIEAGTVAVLPIDLPETRRPIGFLRREGSAPSLAARLLMDMIREEGAV